MIAKSRQSVKLVWRFCVVRVVGTIGVLGRFEGSWCAERVVKVARVVCRSESEETVIVVVRAVRCE